MGPRLVPISAVVFVWALVIYDSSPALQRVIPQLHMGVPVPMSSDALRAELAIGGAVTVTLLAIWELARIRRRTAAESCPTVPVGYGSSGRRPDDVADPTVVDDAWRAWRGEVAFAEKFVADSPDLGVKGFEPDASSPALRSVLAHMIEEYARHWRHADLLRERIDGRIGQ